MSDTPQELKYCESHEWARLDEDGTITVGITDFAQNALGDIVFIELPEVDVQIETGEEEGVVESVKAASDIYAPIGGKVIEINAVLEDEPEIVNQDAFGDGWFYRIEPHDVSELEDLMDADSYIEMCESEAQ